MKKSQLQEIIREILTENPEQMLGKQLAIAFNRKKATQSNQFKQTNDGDDTVNESFILSALGWILATNTTLDLLGKYGAIVFEKFGFDKTSNALKSIHDWAHNNEKNFLKFIGGFLTPFVKDEEKRMKIAKALFIVVLAGLGIKAGIAAMDAIKGASNAGAILPTLKAALKGRDIAVVAADIAKAM